MNETEAIGYHFAKKTFFNGSKHQKDLSQWNWIYTFMLLQHKSQGFLKSQTGISEIAKSFQFKNKRTKRKMWHWGHPEGLYFSKPPGFMSIMLISYQTWQLLMISFMCLIESMEESLSASPSKTGLLPASCDTKVARFLAQTCVSGWKERHKSDV